jgi:ubiquitin-activating enzyme E1 C
LQGVVKSIIPAIASTNALIAASSVLEALKLVSFAAQTMNNYFMYMGQEGLYSATQALERKADCAACGRGTVTMTVPGSDSLEALIARLKEDPERQLSNPSLGIPGKQLYFAAPPALRAATSANLRLRLCDLMADGQEVTVTDPVMPRALSIVLRFAECSGASEAGAGAGGS